MTKKLGIDISRHQGEMNWNVVSLHEPPVEFIGIRAGISWGYTDNQFAVNWVGAKSIDIPRMAYHVLYPKENIQRQVDHFESILGDDYGEMPVVADIELLHDSSKSAMANSIREYVLRLEDKFGRRPIIYSRASFFDYSVDRSFIDTIGNNYYWWLAHYLSTAGVEATFPPAVPHGLNRDRVIIHQTADTMPAIGGQSHSMDFNRWLVTDQLYEEITGGVTEPEPPVEPPTPPENPEAITEIVTQLKVIQAEGDKFSVLMGGLK